MKKILIYNSGGGLGDSIQIFSLILSLKNHFKNSDIYYLTAHENHFNKSLKEFKIEVINLDLNIKYFGFRFWHYFLTKFKFSKQKLKKFDLIIDLQSKIRNTLILKQIPHSIFFSSTFNYKFTTEKKKYNSNNITENLSNLLNQKISDREFDLSSLDKKLFLEAEKLLPENNYFGFSLTQGNKYRKKSWKLENFINLANELVRKNKKPVFLIKDNKSLIQEIKAKVPEALFPETQINNSSPGLVTALATRLENAITIDNGVMHMMGLAKIKMIVLFGPTNSEKFAPKYEGVKILDSKKIYNSTNINLISVEDVLKEI